MKAIDIVIPVINEAQNVAELCRRIHASFVRSGWEYRCIFIVDPSNDGTFEVIEKLSATYPITVRHKQGKPGKAYSIVEGVALATTEYVTMIDGDLQYPPEAIPDMLKLTPQHGVVIAERKVREGSLIRRIVSLCGAYLVGKLLLRLVYDIQSGLKVFRRDIVAHIDPNVIYGW